MRRAVGWILGGLLALRWAGAVPAAEGQEAGGSVSRPEPVAQFLLNLDYQSTGSERYVGPALLGCPDGSPCFLHDAAMPADAISVALGMLPAGVRQAAAGADGTSGARYALLVRKQAAGLAEVTAERCFDAATGRELAGGP